MQLQDFWLNLLLKNFNHILLNLQVCHQKIQVSISFEILIHFQIIIVYFALQYTYYKQNRTVDYYQPLDNSVGNSWQGMYNLKQGLTDSFPFYIKNSLKDNTHQLGYFSIKDLTWEEKYVNDENFTYLETLRNISGSVAFQNGNYSSNQQTGIQYKGVYYPQLERGYAVFKYKQSSFSEPKYEQNDTVDQLVQEINWPPIVDTYLTQEDIDNYQTKTKCPGYIYFQLQKQITQKPVKTLNDIYYKQVNDTFQEGEQYYQYKLNYTIISRDCAFIFQSEIMDIYQQNEQENQFAYFYAIYLPLCIISCILQIVFIFKSNLVFVQDFPLSVLIFWSNASYLYIVGIISYTIQVSYTIKCVVFCVMTQLISLISPTLKLALKGLQNHENDSNCKRTGILIGYVLSGMVIGFVVIICCFYFNVIYVVFPMCCVLMSYIPLYSLIMLFSKKMWQKPLLPIQFLIGENGIKLILLYYIFCYDKNFGNNETNIMCLISLGILGLFYIIYIIQLYKGAKFGKIPKAAQEETYDYSGHLIPESYLLEFKQVQSYEGTKIPFQPDNWNTCKICKNMTHIHQQAIKGTKQKQFQSQGDCFCYIQLDSYQIICPICLGQIDLEEYLEDINGSILSSQDQDYILKGTVKNNQDPEKQKLNQKNKKELSETALYITPCKHCFHRECLNKWLEQHRQCPSCRQQLLQSRQ